MSWLDRIGELVTETKIAWREERMFRNVERLARLDMTGMSQAEREAEANRCKVSADKLRGVLADHVGSMSPLKANQYRRAILQLDRVRSLLSNPAPGGEVSS